MTSKMLKEAIADAKAVRETALANAKIALEEAFAPKLQSMLSKKLKEELEEPVKEEDEKDIAENDVSSEIGKGDNKKPASKAFDSAAESDELGAADVTKTSKQVGLEDPNRKKVADISEGEDERDPEHHDVTGATPGSATNEDVDPDQVEEDEETQAPVEEDDDLDLDAIIKELEDEAGEEPTAAPVAEDENEPHIEEDDTIEITDEADTDHVKEDEDMATAPVEEDEHEEAPVAHTEGGEPEVDLEEILREMGYGDEPVKEDEEEATAAAVTGEGEEEVQALKQEARLKEKKLKEAYKVISSLKGTINEINLLNAKLLYVNKLFRSYNLTNEQKSKVVETVDRTKNVREVKLVYSTIAESFRVGGGVSRKPKNKLTESYASKPAKSTAPAKGLITESTIANRFKKLAGINK